MERHEWHTDPIRARVELKWKLGDILLNPERYNSPEFDETIQDIQHVNHLIRTQGLYNGFTQHIIDNIHYRRENGV